MRERSITSAGVVFLNFWYTGADQCQTNSSRGSFAEVILAKVCAKFSFFCAKLQAPQPVASNAKENRTGMQFDFRANTATAPSPNKPLDVHMSLPVSTGTASQPQKQGRSRVDDSQPKTNHMKELRKRIVRRPTCSYFGCTKSAYFNVEGSVAGIRCSAHKDVGMVDVLNTRCNELGCKKRPVFNAKGTAKGLYCVTHKKKDMLDVVSQKCEQSGCGKNANYNHQGEKGLRFCCGHAQQGMVDRYTKRCEAAGCEVYASFGVARSSFKQFCARHKLIGMVAGKSLISNKMCS